MGDVVFAPIYEVLRKRGVHIKFFHQVKNITLDSKQKLQIENINIVKQVDVIFPEYQPLVSVKNLKSWPSEPKYDLIHPEQSKILREYKINLESFWSNWSEIYMKKTGKDLPLIQLKRGKDFDKVVYGISIASLPHLCAELLQVSNKLKETHSHVKTVATQAFQIWTDTSLANLGWRGHSDPFIGGWGEPLDAYAAMNQVLEREDWASQGKNPKNVAYFCSQLNLSESDFPPRNDSYFPEKMSRVVKQNALQKLTHARDIWPNSFEDGHFNWTVLTGPDDLVGIRRFDSQFWRANIDPSERYVLSVVNSSYHRIRTDGTKLRNIYFTGDWIDTGINIGCVEGAVRGGLKTAEAVVKHLKKDSV